MSDNILVRITNFSLQDKKSLCCLSYTSVMLMTSPYTIMLFFKYFFLAWQLNLSIKKKISLDYKKHFLVGVFLYNISIRLRMVCFRFELWKKEAHSMKETEQSDWQKEVSSSSVAGTRWSIRSLSIQAILLFFHLIVIGASTKVTGSIMSLRESRVHTLLKGTLKRCCNEFFLIFHVPFNVKCVSIHWDRILSPM